MLTGSSSILLETSSVSDITHEQDHAVSDAQQRSETQRWWIRLTNERLREACAFRARSRARGHLVLFVLLVDFVQVKRKFHFPWCVVFRQSEEFATGRCEMERLKRGFSPKRRHDRNLCSASARTHSHTREHHVSAVLPSFTGKPSSGKCMLMNLVRVSKRCCNGLNNSSTSTKYSACNGNYRTQSAYSHACATDELSHAVAENVFLFVETSSSLYSNGSAGPSRSQ